MENSKIPELEQISQYLEKMQFKSQFMGGVNQNNVLEHFEEVNKMYQEIFSRLQDENARQGKQIEQLLKEAADEKVKKQELEKQLKSLQDEFQYFKENDSISAKKEEMYQKYDECKNRVVAAIQALRK